MAYFRVKLADKGMPFGLPEEVSEEELGKLELDQLKKEHQEHWKDPETYLRQGERLKINGYMYWSEYE